MKKVDCKMKLIRLIGLNCGGVVKSFNSFQKGKNGRKAEGQLKLEITKGNKKREAVKRVTF